jgi:hypothetical protein
MVNIAQIAPLSGEFSGSTNVAPTSVSVATSSSGNYDDACLIQDGTAAFYTDGSNFSSGALSQNVLKADYDNQYGSATEVDVEFGAYLRATAATSYSWTLAITSSSFNHGSVALYTAGGGYNNVQDATNFSSDGIGYGVRVTHDGGRGGVTTPVIGDTFSCKLTGTATNSNGSTAVYITTTHTWA